MDNRNKHKSAVLEEIENDESPINETENPKDDPEAAGHIEDPENKDKEGNEADETDAGNETDKDEKVLLDDEELDEETGEARKKPQITKEEVKQTPPDQEERYKEQRREAIIVNEKNKQLSEAFIKANEIKEPTDEELQKAARDEGFEWEELTNFERTQFKKNLVNERKLQILNEVGSKVSNIDSWSKSVDQYLEENENKQIDKALIGREDEFKNYAMKQSHRGVDLQILKSAFLHETPSEQKKTNGSLMLTRTGGEKEVKKDNLQDPDYVARLRKVNPKEYARLSRAGKINIEL